MVVGYTKYLELVEDLTQGKELVSTGMTREVDRVRAAITRASEGAKVALISSGDAGIYGMAGLAIELIELMEVGLPIEVIPGVSAASSAGAKLGAPLALDFATISLSDLLVPWDTIKKRLKAVAEADMVVALYNPKSKKRVSQLKEAAEIFRKYRPGATPVGVCDSISLDGERIVVTTLDKFLDEDIAMRTTVIIGNTSSKIIDGRFVNPRGYDV
ncbi:Cobalt-precorrin-3 C(17)-methyltransferase [hydrothermal vent metagenome]|uniref:Cobalt-precorrin-3 C(17)-methyltransferase n=1 Tax=hydrothermal vent metagenome TaxID=652676 RepID=A0A3B1BVT1_9ZZZZ